MHEKLCLSRMDTRNRLSKFLNIRCKIISSNFPTKVDVRSHISNVFGDIPFYQKWQICVDDFSLDELCSCIPIFAISNTDVVQVFYMFVIPIQGIVIAQRWESGNSGDFEIHTVISIVASQQKLTCASIFWTLLGKHPLSAGDKFVLTISRLTAFNLVFKYLQ